jgi:transposase|tara:strand:+ start:172 stop:480 length:309 start_codon:yes stop_codon:yes gene_type:complete
MPSKVDKIKVGRKYDRRVKLTLDQRAEIKKIYGTLSQRKIAADYGVSRRTIQFIGDPEKHEENKRRREERGGSKIYYDKDRHNEAIKNLRGYKKELLILGKI